METPSQEIKNNGNDVEEKPKVENEILQVGEQKEKIVEKETPPQEIKNKGYDAQEKPKVEHVEGGDEKEKIVENETPLQDIKKKVEDDAQEKPNVEHDEEKHEKAVNSEPQGKYPSPYFSRTSEPPGRETPPSMQTGSSIK